jgi:hypothetical protein
VKGTVPSGLIGNPLAKEPTGSLSQPSSQTHHLAAITLRIAEKEQRLFFQIACLM